MRNGYNIFIFISDTLPSATSLHERGTEREKTKRAQKKPVEFKVTQREREKLTDKKDKNFYKEGFSLYNYNCCGRYKPAALFLVFLQWDHR